MPNRPFNQRLLDFFSQTHVRTTLNLSLSIVASLFFVIFAIRPTLKTIASLKKQIDDETQILALLDQKTQALRSAENTYYQNQGYFDSLNRALPVNPEIVRINAQLAFLASRYKITLTTLSFGQFDLLDPQLSAPAGPGAGSQVLTFNLALEAPWQDTKSFILDLENLDRIVTINTVTHTADSKNDTAVIATSIQGEIYYFPKGEY